MLDLMAYTADEREHLVNWSAERERAFPAWVRRYGTGLEWDFSRASVAARGRLVLAADPADDGFRGGAGWYAGEAMRRTHGGVWLYRHDTEQSATTSAARISRSALTAAVIPCPS